MKICIVGAGSIGGYLAVAGFPKPATRSRYVRAARTLMPYAERGLELIQEDGTHKVGAQSPCPPDSIRSAGSARSGDTRRKSPPGRKPIVDELPALLHDDTIMIPMQNGIPWWYFQRHGGEYERGRSCAPPTHTARSPQPSTRRASSAAWSIPQRLIAAPGVIRHIEGNRFPLGELDGTETQRIRGLSDLFTDAGFKSPILTSIRNEIWLKLWGNLSFNPISALTHTTLVDLCRFRCRAISLKR